MYHPGPRVLTQNHIKATKTRLSENGHRCQGSTFFPKIPSTSCTSWMLLNPPPTAPEKWGKAGDNCRKTMGFYRDNDWKAMEHPETMVFHHQIERFAVKSWNTEPKYITKKLCILYIYITLFLDMNKSTICIHLHIVFLSNNVMILSNVAAAPCLQSIYEFLPMKRLFLYWFVWNYIGYRTSF